MSAKDDGVSPSIDTHMSERSASNKNRSDTAKAAASGGQSAEAASSDDVSQSFRDMLTVRLPHIQASLNAQASAILAREAGLSLIQWRILFLLVRMGPATATQINEVSAMDPGLLSRKIKAMADSDMLQVQPSVEDHRRKLLSITPLGRRLFEKALPAMRQRQERIRSFLPPEDMLRFLDYLDQLSTLAEEDM